MIIIHHSLTKDGRVNDWNAIRKYHMSYALDGNIISKERALQLLGQGVKGIKYPYIEIGYHGGVELVGDKYVWQIGRSVKTAGAHTRGYNNQSLGVCFVGNYDLIKPPEEMLELGAEKIAIWVKQFGLKIADIRTHHEFASYKSCPGKLFPMDDLRDLVKEKI